MRHDATVSSARVLIISIWLLGLSGCAAVTNPVANGVPARLLPPELLAEEKQVFLPLPEVAFEACRIESRRVTSLSLVRFETNSYSTPVRYAHREVVVKAFADRVVICWKDETIACHRRSYAQHDYLFDPLHYLPLLERKPGGLDGSLPFSGWELPGSFDLLRRVLESRRTVAVCQHGRKRWARSVEDQASSVVKKLLPV